MKRVRTTLLLIFLLFGLVAQAQVSEDWEKDTEIMNRFFAEAQGLPVDSAMLRAGLFFLNAPYVGGTLEGEEEETLIVNLREFDCMTLVESCLALSRCLAYPAPDMDYFERMLRQIRYRNGNLDGYTSRLHYTSDWIRDNADAGIVEDITRALGGYRIKMDVHYLSKKGIAGMKEIEDKINARNTYYYIPKEEIDQCASKIKNGDIICFVTTLKDLDIAHLGIAYWHKNQLTFVHASSTAEEVIINPESLADYCRKIKSNKGIMILRTI